MDVISHSITQDLKMRDGLKRGMRYKLEVSVSPVHRENTVEHSAALTKRVTASEVPAS